MGNNGKNFWTPAAPAGKVIIVGGMAAGASAAARLRRLDENLEIIVLEKGEHISYASCGLPYYIGNVIEDRKKLIIQSPLGMKKRFNLDVRTGHEAMEINSAAKTVRIQDHRTGVDYEETYGCLLLCIGAAPIIPGLPGIEKRNVFTVRDIPDSDVIKSFIETLISRTATIIGAGPIGLEIANMLRRLGMEVHLVDLAGQAMPAFDPDMVSFVHEELQRNQVQLHFGAAMKRLEISGDVVKTVFLDNGTKINTDILIVAIGVKPEIDLAKRAGLAVGETGGVLVDEYLRTSDPCIYAAGDLIQTRNIVSGAQTVLSAAGPANRQGWIAANNICGAKISYQGVQGTLITKVFDKTAASTGLNEKNLKRLGMPYKCIHVVPDSRAAYYPGATQLTVKLIFNPMNGYLLGAQLFGTDGVDKRADILAAAIRGRLTVYELQELELAYAPPYSSAKDPVNIAGYAAANVVGGLIDVIMWTEVSEYLHRNNAFLLDVRTDKEFSKGCTLGAYNIPVDALRERCLELPADQEILVYCLSGLRSYVASRILMQRGFKVKNISGGYHLYQRLKGMLE